MTTLLQVKARVLHHWIGVRFRCLFDFSDTPSTHIGQALSVGTTLTTRLWVALFSMAIGGQVLLEQPSMFSQIGEETFFRMIPSTWWTVSMFTCGLGMLWRVLGSEPRPWVAWVVNCFAFALWSSIVLIRFALIGGASLASTATVVTLMCAWLVMRTEATPRDQETA